MYEELYGKKDEEDGPWIHKVPESAEEIIDLMEILRGVHLADESEVPIEHS